MFYAAVSHPSRSWGWPPPVTARQRIVSMISLVEAARVCIEAYLGWTMLARCATCCKSGVTESSLRALLARVDPEAPTTHGPVPSFGRYLQRWAARILSPMRHLANRAPNTAFPVIMRRHGGFPYQAPLRRVRIQHMTRWERPIGARQAWNDLHAPFQTLGFEIAAQLWEQAGSPDVATWRQVTRRPLTEHLVAEFVTSTAQFGYQGFYVELVEQTTIFVDAGPSDESKSPSSPSSPSSGRRLRQQHAGLEVLD